MKVCDSKTNVFKLVQQKDLPVRIEKEDNFWSVLHEDYFIHEFSTREKAVNFCRELGFKVIAFIYPKENNLIE